MKNPCLLSDGWWRYSLAFATSRSNLLVLYFVKVYRMLVYILNPLVLTHNICSIIGILPKNRIVLNFFILILPNHVHKRKAFLRVLEWLLTLVRSPLYYFCRYVNEKLDKPILLRQEYLRKFRHQSPLVRGPCLPAHIIIIRIFPRDMVLLILGIHPRWPRVTAQVVQSPERGRRYVKFFCLFCFFLRINTRLVNRTMYCRQVQTNFKAFM